MHCAHQWPFELVIKSFTFWKNEIHNWRETFLKITCSYNNNIQLTNGAGLQERPNRASSPQATENVHSVTLRARGTRGVWCENYPSVGTLGDIVGQACAFKRMQVHLKKMKMLETMVLPERWGLGGLSCNFRPNMVNFRKISTRSFKKLKKPGSRREVPCWLPGDGMNAWPPLRTITNGCWDQRKSKYYV